MSYPEPPHAAEPRLPRLLRFLASDPGNHPLLADAAAAALDEGQPDQALELLARHAEAAPLPPALANLRGLALLSLSRFEEAAEAFAALVAGGHDNPQVRFNLAWARAGLGDHEQAAALLDEEVVQAVPRAAAMKVRSFHHLGRLEDALAAGQGLAEIRPQDADLMAALATVAIDAGEPELARFYADKGGDAPDALAALGTLMLGENRPEESLELFEKALAARPENARSLIGKGMVLMAQGEAESAAPWLERGAERFGDHIGSWVAAGWAQFVAGDYRASRARFETALAIDDTFAETHGGLAVLDIVEGNVDNARRRTDVALRLDRNCFAGALAKSMLLDRAGEAAAAERVRTLALNTPIAQGGPTIAAAMAALNGAKPRRGR